MTKVLQIPRIILLSFLCLCLRYKAFRLCIIISCSVKSQLCNTSAKFNSFLKTKKNKKKHCDFTALSEITARSSCYSPGPQKAYYRKNLFALHYLNSFSFEICGVLRVDIEKKNETKIVSLVKRSFVVKRSIIIVNECINLLVSIYALPSLKKKMHPFLTVESGNCFKMGFLFLI